ncbi:hypothetical protein C8Q72DRAFT_885417 [Fomitopsis betulina]|nr:hypothetical protein C8Q72DRAFT_885417 [Fomitopsis betulina]
MSTDSSSPSDILINVKGPSELKLQITISTDKTVADLKQAIADKSDVPADRQRLIYSGRVLKDEEALSTYKIQSSHTIHMVKGAARNSAASSSQGGPPPQALPQMQAGQNVHDPLTQLNGHMGFGVMGGLNPFAELGLNTNDPNLMQGMWSNPAFLQQMSTLMSNPAIVDQIIASNPQLAGMGPQVRQVFQSEQFRQMMANPESLRMMLQMSSLMRGGAPGAPGGPGSFPAPGLPSTARPQGQDGQSQSGSTPTAGAPGAGVPPMLFPFAPPSPAGGSNAAPPGGLFDPALMQQMLAAMGGGAGAGAGAGLGAGGGGTDPFGLGAFGGLGRLGAFGGAPAAPTDTRPPEERFQVQLQQLQDMGFTNAQQNVRALLATGGNVHSAIEYILGGGGL